MKEINLRNYAYLGDAVWELFVRQKTIYQTNNSKKLHQLTTNLVKTHTQYELLYFLNDKLTPEELEIARQARNLPIPVGRRNIQNEYRHATAFEALIGWWYQNDKQRFNAIVHIINEQFFKKS